MILGHDGAAGRWAPSRSTASQVDLGQAMSSHQLGTQTAHRTYSPEKFCFPGRLEPPVNQRSGLPRLPIQCESVPQHDCPT
jgi:hypothetical protein